MAIHYNHEREALILDTVRPGGFMYETIPMGTGRENVPQEYRAAYDSAVKEWNIRMQLDIDRRERKFEQEREQNHRKGLVRHKRAVKRIESYSEKMEKKIAKRLSFLEDLEELESQEIFDCVDIFYKFSKRRDL